MKKLESTLKEYRLLNTLLSIEDERELLYNYVYSTNKLEGNQLTLAQTSQLLSTDTITGSNVRTKDILEQKGMYKALIRMLKAVREKEQLSASLLLEFNWLSIGQLWKYEDSYIGAKGEGQKEGFFKVSQNVISISQGGKTIQQLVPLSTPENVDENINELITSVQGSNKFIVTKAAFLAQELWLHQPFVDGNKRVGRLAINFLTMNEGFPLFVFEEKSRNYNSLLVEQYIDKKPGLIESYIENALIKTMKRALDIKKDKGKDMGYRMML